MTFAFLLLAQQLGVIHATSHIASDISTSGTQKKQLPAEMQCEQCLAFSALSSGLVAAPPPLILLDAPTDAVVAGALARVAATAFDAFRSRAPPLSS